MGKEFENIKLQEYYKDIFRPINEICSDYDTLVIGTEIVKIAKNRLDSDLNNEEIKKEYDKLCEITKELNEIINNYV